MNSYLETLAEASRVFDSLKDLEPGLNQASAWCVEALRGGGKLLVCGNGGSAAEAQHLVGELMGRYKKDRRPLAAVALTADSALLTCIGNDYDYRDVFARQLRGLARPGDILVAFTSSGESPNVLAALEAARETGVRSIAFLGRDGGRALAPAGCALLVRHPETARVQEAHQFLLHCLMDRIEDGFRETA